MKVDRIREGNQSKYDPKNEKRSIADKQLWHKWVLNNLNECN